MNHGVRSGIDNFRVTDVTYNRNGIGGQPFYTVRFSYTDVANGDRFMSNMLAIVPYQECLDPDEKETEVKTSRDGLNECYVVDLNNPTANWRGDNFMDIVHAGIRARNVEEARMYRAKLRK